MINENIQTVLVSDSAIACHRTSELSASQVHRLVSGTPERLSLQVLSGFCDILGCTPADLVATNAENASVRKTATDDRAAPSTVTKLRPRPARSSRMNEPCLHHA